MLARSPMSGLSSPISIDALHTWRRDLTRIERLPVRDWRTAWIEHGKMAIESVEHVESGPLQRMVTNIADSTLPSGGTWTYQLCDTGDGCMITITENGEVRNPLFRFMPRFLIGHETTLRGYLKPLGHKLGDPADIERLSGPATGGS